MKCIASAVIGALGSVAAGAVSSAISGNNSRQAVREQNEYNKPINQRARFEEAGLNPYLAMGSGAIGAGNQTAAADMSGANNAMANGLLSGMQQIGQISLLKSQIDNQKADAANKIEEAKGKVIDNKTKEAKNAAELAILQEQQKDWKFKVDSVNPQTLQKGKAEIDLLIQKYKSEIQNTDNLQELGKKIISETRLNNLKGDEQQAVNDQIVQYLQLQQQVMRMTISTGYQNANSNEISANANATSAAAAMKNADTNEMLGTYQKGLLQQQTQGQIISNKESWRQHKYNAVYHNNPKFEYWMDKVGQPLMNGLGNAIPFFGLGKLSTALTPKPRPIGFKSY